MGMHVDLQQGESVIAFLRDDGNCRMTITLEKKLGTNRARLDINADQSIVLVPPKKAKSPHPER